MLSHNCYWLHSYITLSSNTHLSNFLPQKHPMNRMKKKHCKNISMKILLSHTRLPQSTLSNTYEQLYRPIHSLFSHSTQISTTYVILPQKKNDNCFTCKVLFHIQDLPITLYIAHISLLLNCGKWSVTRPSPSFEDV